MYASYRIPSLKIDLLEATEYFYMIRVERGMEFINIKNVDISDADIIFSHFWKIIYLISSL